jgi:hypothetical protein
MVGQPISRDCSIVALANKLLRHTSTISSGQTFKKGLAFACVFGFLFAFGCQDTRDEMSRSDKQLKELYQQYFLGDIKQARDALNRCIPIFERAHYAGNAPVKYAPSTSLWLAYARLYVLERKAADSALAEVYLVKARYWYLVTLEISGHYSTKEALEAVNGFDSSKCEQVVSRLDTASGTMKDRPRYLHKM